MDVFHSAERRLYDKLGLIAVIPVHDEFLCSVNPKTITKEDFLEVLSETPEFLDKKQIPKLDVEFWKGDRYEQKD